MKRSVRRCELCGRILGLRLQGTRCRDCPNDDQLALRVEMKLLGEILTEEMLDKFSTEMAKLIRLPKHFLFPTIDLPKVRLKS